MTASGSFSVFVNRLCELERLSEAETAEAFNYLVSGTISDAQIAAFLVALRLRGETVDEIVGATRAMRSVMRTVTIAPGAVDLVGTGGDVSGSLNISTAAAFIVAGCGVPVAKHGNRAVSSKSGSADVLKALGIAIELEPSGVARCVAEAGIGFMFAPNFHPALKAVMPVRISLSTRTIFNILGPLLNPAGVRHHLIGVYDERWLNPIAAVLARLGSERALVVHGRDGLDELTVTASSRVTYLHKGSIQNLEIVPEDFGLSRYPANALRGGTAEENALALMRTLEGAPGAYRDIAILNAAGGLFARGRVDDFSEGVAMARASLDSGMATDCLKRLVAVSNQSAIAMPVDDVAWP